MRVILYMFERKETERTIASILDARVNAQIRKERIAMAWL